MSECAMPFLFINCGAEMLFVLNTRLVAQHVDCDRAKGVMRDVATNMFSPSLMDELFRPQNIYTTNATRQVFTTLSDSSVVRLSENSMKKLFDLMVMGVKQQVITLKHPLELLECTLNHLDNVKKVVPSDTVACINAVAERVIALARGLSVADFAEIRRALLNFSLRYRVKVSVFLEDGSQNKDGSFALPPDTYVPPTPTNEAPGTIRYYSESGITHQTSFTHKYASLTLPAHVARGNWHPCNSALRVSQNGRNMYDSGDALAKQTREMPAPKPAVSNRQEMLSSSMGASSLGAVSPTPSQVQLRAFNMEMSHLAQLAGGRVAKAEGKIFLNIFGDDDDGEVNVGPSTSCANSNAERMEAYAVPSTTTAASTVAHEGRQAQPSAASVVVLAAPVATAPSPVSVPVLETEDQMVRVCKTDAKQLQHENQQLLGIIGGLSDAKAAPAASGGDDLLDIMDEI